MWLRRGVTAPCRGLTVRDRTAPTVARTLRDDARRGVSNVEDPCEDLSSGMERSRDGSSAAGGGGDFLWLTQTGARTVDTQRGGPELQP